MSAASLNDLAWIHDCSLLSVVYEHIATEVVVRLICKCPIDLGHNAWSGRRISITADKVAMSRQLVFGVVGIETISAIREGISDELKRLAAAAQERGARFPDMQVTVFCSSGGSIELICEAMMVDILD